MRQACRPNRARLRHDPQAPPSNFDQRLDQLGRGVPWQTEPQLTRHYPGSFTCHRRATALPAAWTMRRSGDDLWLRPRRRRHQLESCARARRRSQRCGEPRSMPNIMPGRPTCSRARLRQQLVHDQSHRDGRPTPPRPLPEQKLRGTSSRVSLRAAGVCRGHDRRRPRLRGGANWWFHRHYGETDLTGGGLGLAFNSVTANDTRSELGAHFDGLTMFSGMPLIARPARMGARLDEQYGARRVPVAARHRNFVVNSAKRRRRYTLASAA